jgi:nucleoid DNA-binding protein
MPKATGARRMAQGTTITQVQAAQAFYSCMARMQLSLSRGERVGLGGFNTVALDPDYDSGHQARVHHAPSKRASSGVQPPPCDGVELGTL